MNKETMIKFILNKGIIKDGKLRPSYYMKKLEPMLDELEKLPGDTIQEKLYLLYHNIEKPKCLNPGCNNDVKFLTFSKGYNQTCCNSCAQKTLKQEIK